MHPYLKVLHPLIHELLRSQTWVSTQPGCPPGEVMTLPQAFQAEGLKTVSNQLFRAV